MDTPELDKAIDKYFEQQRVSLWGASFAILESDDRMDAAKKFVRDLILEVTPDAAR